MTVTGTPPDSPCEEPQGGATPPQDEGETQEAGTGQPPQPTPAGGTFRCGYYDVALVSQLQDLLLQGLASAAMKQVEGIPFKSISSAAPKVQTELVDFLRAGSQRARPWAGGHVQDPHSNHPVSPTLRAVADLLGQFSHSRRNVFSKVSHVFVDDNDAKLVAAVAQLRQGDAWPVPQREAFTQELIRILDTHGKEHCLVECASGEELAKHKSFCDIRPMSCPFEGCSAVFQAGHFFHHDGVCPYKPVQCRQGCPDKVPRNRMDEHCSGPCAHKVVLCPFSPLGCDERVLQGVYNEHLQQFVAQHLLQIKHAVDGQGLLLHQQSQQMKTTISTMSGMAKDSPEQIQKLRSEVKDLHKSMDKKLSSFNQEIADLKKDNVELKKALKQATKDHQADLQKQNTAQAAEIQKLMHMVRHPSS